MFNTSTLPGSIAVPISTELPELKGFYYTAKEGKDETPIYQELNHRLMQLETSTELHVDELNAIENVTANLVVSVEAKEEVLLRIDWLTRLYEVKNLLPSVSLLSETERLRTMLSPVQTCPLKIQLQSELGRLASSLPVLPTKLETVHDQVMDLAIEQAGEAFINLGKAGREHVVQQVIEKFGKSVSVNSIQQATNVLGEQVERLAKDESIDALQEHLGNLPLTNYSILSVERKRLISEQLLKKANWRGLAPLDRMIRQLDTAITNEEKQIEEAKNTMPTSDGKAALTLDIKNVANGRVQLR